MSYVVSIIDLYKHSDKLRHEQLLGPSKWRVRDNRTNSLVLANYPHYDIIQVLWLYLDQIQICYQNISCLTVII